MGGDLITLGIEKGRQSVGCHAKAQNPHCFAFAALIAEAKRVASFITVVMERATSRVNGGSE